MTRFGHADNKTKTAVRDARQEHFDFLGYNFGPNYYRKDGHWCLGASLLQKSVPRLKARAVSAPPDLASAARAIRAERWPSLADWPLMTPCRTQVTGAGH
jgi:hypothetical protein